MSKGTKRAGAHLLLTAADPINRQILQEMLSRPIAAGAGLAYQITPGGRQGLFIGSVIERWLQSAPQGPLPLESREAQRAVAALAEGWSTTVMHALAREPLTFAELHELVEGLGERALKRQLTAMRDLEQIEEIPTESGEPIYAVTDWLRAGIAPLIASARLERREPKEGMAPIDALDVDAGFRCSLRFIELPEELTGTCRLGINLEEDESGSLTGVTARIEQGCILSCEAGLGGKANAWAAGSAGDWLDAVVEGDAKRVRTGGDKWLTRAVVKSLHKALFGVPVH